MNNMKSPMNRKTVDMKSPMNRKTVDMKSPMNRKTVDMKVFLFIGLFICNTYEKLHMKTPMKITYERPYG